MSKQNICDQLEKDANIYADRIKRELGKIDPHVTPVSKDIGDAYMRAYRKAYGIPFVIKISKEVLAYMYKYVVDNGLEGAAVGFAKYDKNELGSITDPNWNQRKENQNTVVLGTWDDNKGISPIKTAEGDIYDDWSQEWP